MKRKDAERGAAAVEAAFILPVLLLLVMGIMEFGFLFNQQISATNAAREGARFAAIHYNDPGFGNGQAVAAARAAAPTLSEISTAVVVSSCSPGATVTVTVQPPIGWLIGFIPLTAPQITGQAVMQCGG